MKGVIFDMDGVIFDSEPIHMELEKGIFGRLGIEVSDEEHHSYIGTTSMFMWEAIKNRYKLDQMVEELIELERNTFLEFLMNSAGYISPIIGVELFIRKLYENGFKLAIASSSPMNVIKEVVNRFGIGRYFDNLTTGDYVKKSKPEPDILIYAADKLGISPMECLVVEDSHNGVLAAKRAGMKCLGYKNVNSGNQDLSSADIVVDSFSNIDIELLKNLF